MIEIKSVYKSYDSRIILKDINFSFAKGDICVLLGQNGAGKSTLIKIICSLIKADKGEVVFSQGVGVEKIAYVPELVPLYPELTVLEYLKFYAKLRGLNRKLLSSKIDEVYELLGLKEYSNCLCSFLSKGYKQRLGLAQAIMSDPEILVLDEPLSGLDIEQADEILSLLKVISKKSGLLVSTHALSSISSICTKAVVLHNSSLKEVSEVGELSSSSLLEDLYKKVVH